jgi:hypothetical protein
MKTSSNLNPAIQNNNNNQKAPPIIIPNRSTTPQITIPITNRNTIPQIPIPNFENTYDYQNSQQQHHQQPIHDNQAGSSSKPGPRRSPGFFVYLEKLVSEGVTACQRSILGKLITSKPVHVNSIQMGLDSIWGSPPGLKIQEIEGKILQFFVDDNMDQERILQGNPWIFRNSWLIVHPWDRKTDPTSIDFGHAPVWIQLWGLPPHCKTKKMGESIGELLGKVEASEFYEYPGKKMIIKIKVAIDVKEPIAAGILIGNANDGTHWIDFRYEKLPQVCFRCGILGHADNLCQNQQMEQAEVAPLGPWIRSNQYGRRVMEAKDKKYHSNPSMSKDFGHYSPPIPASILEQMQAMKIQDDKEAARPQQHKTSHNTHNHQDNANKPPAQSMLTPTKRQRVNLASSSSQNEMMLEDTQMAGLGKQASQQL